MRWIKYNKNTDLFKVFVDLYQLLIIVTDSHRWYSTINPVKPVIKPVKYNIVTYIIQLKL